MKYLRYPMPQFSLDRRQHQFARRAHLQRLDSLKAQTDGSGIRSWRFPSAI